MCLCLGLSGAVQRMVVACKRDCMRSLYVGTPLWICHADSAWCPAELFVAAWFHPDSPQVMKKKKKKSALFDEPSPDQDLVRVASMWATRCPSCQLGFSIGHPALKCSYLPWYDVGERFCPLFPVSVKSMFRNIARWSYTRTEKELSFLSVLHHWFSWGYDVSRQIYHICGKIQWWLMEWMFIQTPRRILQETWPC